jgi:FkbM family methyltransferase
MPFAHMFTSARARLVVQAIGLAGPRRRRILAWRTIWDAGVRSVTFEREGIVWQLSPDCDPHIGFGLFVDGGWHVPEMAALASWMRRHHLLDGRRNTLVDVGANIGSTCIPLARMTGCRVLAIEPVGSACRALRANVDANGLGARIQIVNKAVMRTAGDVRVCMTPGTSGGSFVWRGAADDPGPGNAAICEDVRADGLGAIIASASIETDDVALVWADVEGSESEVIQSGADLWARGAPLWAEINPEAQARLGGVSELQALAAAHFDRFIPSPDLVRMGPRAMPLPVRTLASFIETIAPGTQTDVLLLPTSLPLQPFDRP